MRGRAPIHTGQAPGLSDYSLGQSGGAEAVTLTVSQMPAHSHVAALRANPTEGNTVQPARNYLGLASQGTQGYFSGSTPANYMAADSINVLNTGGSQPVNTRGPYLTMRWCVALQGIFPSRN